MKSFLVFLPSKSKAATNLSDEERLARAQFVSDNFNLLAFIFPLIWCIWHRQIVLGILYLALTGAVSAFASSFTPIVFLIFNFVFGLAVALEASTLQRWRLLARGWEEVDAFVAHDLEDAETRFFERAEIAHKNDIDPAPLSPAAPQIIGYAS